MSSLQILFIGLAFLCYCAFGIKCPREFEEYNHACYMVVESQVDYVSAQSACAVRNSNLLNVDATPELDFVKRLVGGVGRWVPGFWIGGLYDPTRAEWNFNYRMLSSFYLDLYPEHPSKKLGYICETEAI